MLQGSARSTGVLGGPGGTGALELLGVLEFYWGVLGYCPPVSRDVMCAVTRAFTWTCFAGSVDCSHRQHTTIPGQTVGAPPTNSHTGRHFLTLDPKGVSNTDKG